MSNNSKVGFKLCGNCNPLLQTSRFYKALKEIIDNLDGFVITSKDDPNLDVLIVISGCPVDCAERPEGNYQEMVITAETLNWSACDFSEIINQVVVTLKTQANGHSYPVWFKK